MQLASDLLPEGYEGRVSERLMRFLDAARQRFGLVGLFRGAAKDKTFRLYVEGIDLGYVNPSVMRQSRAGVMGVHFPENDGDHLLDAQQASIEQQLQRLLPSTASVGVDYVFHLADGSRTQGRQYLVLKSVDLALAWIASRLPLNVNQNPISLPDWRPDEVDPSEPLWEGAVKRVDVNAYERNPDARRRCIETHNPICQACNFDFGAVYGEIGQGFIHVHHRVEISSVGESYQIDPIKDLVPVCPNCHAMLHTHRPALTVEELRAIIERRRG